ncbi:GntR family transcriptional regulator [Hydrogenophaga sp. 2FB]|uniref:GntR family transcriptional regulator n=1 Tax=Hydrogenophaga sp. 2FB TaxID=2502187 RepID=UPI0010F9D983|nr:GntR family transcriptional regulator [Hydrogenophaga sp. 2FB]
MTKLANVSNAMMAAIESGVFHAGDRLPSETELAASHGVSVDTIQKVLKRLVERGLIRREHGRGTFVSGKNVVAADGHYLRFMDEQGTELPRFVQLLSVKRVKRKGAWSEFLGGEAFVRIERLTDVATRFSFISEFWLREDDYEKMGNVERGALEKNLRELVRERLALSTLRVEQLVRYSCLPEKIAAKLSLDPTEPGFIMELCGHSLQDRPLYYLAVFAPKFSERLALGSE